MLIRVKNNIKWLVLGLCLISFLVITYFISYKDILNSDIVGYNFISSYLINNRLTPIVKIITNCGSDLCLIIITVLLLLFLKNKRISISILCNLVIVTILNLVIKLILQRPRPIDNRLIEEIGYSFPSGHSMISMAFYGYLIYLICKHIENKFVKYFLVVVILLLIFLIGISRVYLGVHYITDVVGGQLLAISYLIVYIHFTNKIINEVGYECKKVNK